MTYPETTPIEFPLADPFAGIALEVAERKHSSACRCGSLHASVHQRIPPMPAIFLPI
jgi:hypothetical protein